MKLTKEQAIREHRKMWNWLAEHPDKCKSDYLELNNFGHINNDCFLCEYSNQNNGRFCDKDCILHWGNTNGCCEEGNILGLYEVYNSLRNDLCCMDKDSEWSEDIIKALYLTVSCTARTISELPERLKL